jgi:DNA repair exonuclease SbcCD ATPase subunit
LEGQDLDSDISRLRDVELSLIEQERELENVINSKSSEQDRELEHLSQLIESTTGAISGVKSKFPNVDRELSQIRSELDSHLFPFGRWDASQGTSNPRHLGIGLSSRAVHRESVRQKIKELQVNLLKCKAEIALLTATRSSMVRQINSEILRLRRPPPVGQALDTALYERLRNELTVYDNEFAKMTPRLNQIKQQLTECNVRPHTIDKHEFEEEEDESDFTADELIDRLQKFRGERNQWRDLHETAQKTKASLESRKNSQARVLTRVEDIVNNALSHNVITGRRGLRDFPS